MLFPQRHSLFLIWELLLQVGTRQVLALTLR